MKHLKKFKTIAGFQAAQATLDRPNVSLIEATMGVNYLPYVAPVVPQHDYVEIGGIKWATMNVGASSITEAGLYFQWGDTTGYTASQVGSGEGQKYFGWEDYKYSEDDTASDVGTITKYNDSDGLTTLQSSDDAVTAAWGDQWRMPTVSEWEAFCDVTNQLWTTDYLGSGVSGLVCTDKTDSSKVLFFPAAGFAGDGSLDSVGSEGYYWLSSFYYDDAGWSIGFNTEWGVDWIGSKRRIGLPVRGVYDK